jgi:hypothetical protein
MKNFLFISCLFCIAPFAIAQKDSCGTSKFDHIVFFVSDSSIERTLGSVLNIGELLTAHHVNQGTISHFYLFYNTFLEFIYPVDTSVISLNSKNLGSDYLQRWNSNEKVCRLGIGQINIPFDSTCSDFHTYHSKDNSGYYLMSINNVYASDVFLYSSDTLHAHKSIESLKDYEHIIPPEFVKDFKTYTTHPSGVKKLTKLIIFKPDLEHSSNFEAISEFEIIEIKKGEGFKYILEFDKKKQNKILLIEDWLEIRY